VGARLDGPSSHPHGAARNRRGESTTDPALPGFVSWQERRQRTRPLFLWNGAHQEVALLERGGGGGGGVRRFRSRAMRVTKGTKARACEYEPHPAPPPPPPPPGTAPSPCPRPHPTTRRTPSPLLHPPP